MRIVPHTQWCWGKAASGSSVAPAKRTAFCIHYDGGVPTTADGLDAVRKTYKYHTGTNGWQDIGYNFLITQDGQIFEGRGWDKLGAHAGPMGNAPSIGVQIHIGGNQRPSYLAQQAVKWLYKEANARFGRTLQVKGHRDYMSTSCPGDYLYNNWVKTRLHLPPGLPDVGVSVRLVNRVSVAHLKSARFSDPPKSGTPLGSYANEVYTMETALAKTKWIQWKHVDGHFGTATVGDGSSGYGGTTGFQKKHSGATKPDGWLGRRELSKLFSLAGMSVSVVS